MVYWWKTWLLSFLISGAFIPFILAALASRGARFFLVAAILRWGGDRLRNFVEKHFELMTILITLLVVAGFAVIWALG